MKFIQIIAPLTTLSMVLAHGDKPKYTKSKPVSFSQEGITNFINVATKTPGANSKKAVTSVMDFFKRNPEVLQSIMTESSKPEHAEAKNKAISLAMDLYSKGDKIDLYKTGLDLIDYVYENPKFLSLVQKTGIQVMKVSPTLVDDFFAQVEKAVASDPSLVTRGKDYLIDFSNDSEEAYKRGYEMVLKSAMINPAFSSHLLVHILQVDRIGCKGAMKGACDCKKPAELNSGGITKPIEKEMDAEEKENDKPTEEVDGEEIESDAPVETDDGEIESDAPVEDQENEEATPVEGTDEAPEPIENEVQIDEPVAQKEDSIGYARPAYPVKSFNKN